MTTDIARSDAHAEALALLPWYENGSLSQTEHAHVHVHVRDCTVCQAELAKLRILSKQVRSAREQDWKASPAHLAQLMRNIDQLEGSQKKPAAAAGAGGFAQRLLNWFQLTPQPARWALACQTLLVLGLASALLMGRQDAAYQTYSRVETPGATLQAKVLFADDMSVQEMRALLQSTGARVIDGPSPDQGVYVLALTSSEAEQKLKTHPKVRFAQIVQRN